jgi:membrane protein DedA with SNARE-associated domain
MLQAPTSLAFRAHCTLSLLALMHPALSALPLPTTPVRPGHVEVAFLVQANVCGGVVEGVISFSVGRKRGSRFAARWCRWRTDMHTAAGRLTSDCGACAGCDEPALALAMAALNVAMESLMDATHAGL